MGNNTAFGDFEAIVIDLYNIGKLDIDVLDVIGRVFWKPDYLYVGDMGKFYTHNGLNVFQLTIAMIQASEYVPFEHNSDYGVFWEITDARWRSA